MINFAYSYSRKSKKNPVNRKKFQARCNVTQETCV